MCKSTGIHYQTETENWSIFREVMGICIPKSGGTLSTKFLYKSETKSVPNIDNLTSEISKNVIFLLSTERFETAESIEPLTENNK